ncbi:DUF86 domain-containing protein [Bacillus alkalisoli]|uniref:DUF86 domain-containing protein n=1 Tax=Bacillus alkalisoli TaxID=2011008 RepID=UPI000C247E8B|nr:DUF86 domain-containing protein [Bacillus alkalisoli]
MYFVDREKIERTLVYLEENIELFQTHEKYETNLEKKALERIAISIIEGLLDVGNAMIDGFIMRDPGSYEDIIDILLDEKVVNKEQEEKLKQLIRLRKVLVQDYLEIEHTGLEATVRENIDVVMTFCESVRSYLTNELGPVTAFKN